MRISAWAWSGRVLLVAFACGGFACSGFACNHVPLGARCLVDYSRQGDCEQGLVCAAPPNCEVAVCCPPGKPDCVACPAPSGAGGSGGAGGTGGAGGKGGGA